MNKIEEVLHKYGKLIEDKYKQGLLDFDSIATKDLYNTVKYEVKSNGNVYSIVLNLMDYWKWVEYGRKPGKFPPIDKILSWVRVKNIVPKPYVLEDGREVIPNERQIAFLIARSIANNGIEPKPILEDVISDIKDRLIKELLEVLAIEIQLLIINEFRK